MAMRARAVLSKIRGLKKVEFDTTGKGYFLTAKNFEPNAQMIEEALADARLSALTVKSVKEVELPKTVARYEVSVRGLAWMASAMQARAAFSELEGVTRVLAYGHNGKVHVYCSDKKAVDKEIAKDQLRVAGLSLRKIRRF